MSIHKKVRVLLARDRQKERSYPRQLSSLNRAAIEFNRHHNLDVLKDNLEQID